MEPFHQFRFTDKQVPDLQDELERLGFTVTRDSQSWLGEGFPDFCDIIAQRDGKKTVFAVRASRPPSTEAVIVYPNLLTDTHMKTIRKELGDRGAQWGYSSPVETDAVHNQRGEQDVDPNA